MIGREGWRLWDTEYLDDFGRAAVTSSADAIGSFLNGILLAPDQAAMAECRGSTRAISAGPDARRLSGRSLCAAGTYRGGGASRFYARSVCRPQGFMWRQIESR